MIALRTPFHGFTTEIHRLEETGDTVTVHWTVHCTQGRELLGVEPVCIIGQAGDEHHGAAIDVTGTSQRTLRDGRLYKHQVDWELADLH